MMIGFAKKQNKAFTLIELLVVIAIIALLLSVILPGLNKAKRSAKEVICTSNLHQLAVAALTYENDNARLPAHYVEDIRNPGNSPRLGWSEQLASTFTSVDRREIWESYVSADLKVMNCPLLKPLDISTANIPFQSMERRIYAGYTFVSGFWRDRDVNGQWGDESTRWTKTSRPWKYEDRRINVLLGDRNLLIGRAGTIDSYYRINHGARLGLPMNYVDYAAGSEYVVSTYEGTPEAGFGEKDLRRETTSTYCFKDGSAEKFKGDGDYDSMIEIEDEIRGGLQLVPLR